jgi:signal transduction histidine kinase
MMGEVRDKTAAHEQELQQRGVQKRASRNEFVSTVSHELRTPLTSIAASLGLLTGGATGALPEPPCGSSRSRTRTASGWFA